MVRSFVAWLFLCPLTGNLQADEIDFAQRVNDESSENSPVRSLAVADRAAGTPVRTDGVQRHHDANGRAAHAIHSHHGTRRRHRSQDSGGRIPDRERCRRDGAACLCHAHSSEYANGRKHADGGEYADSGELTDCGKHADASGGEFAACGGSTNRYPDSGRARTNADCPRPAGAGATGAGAAGRDESVFRAG
jgi:hypothetical protein